MKTLIIIPAYNEEETLPCLVDYARACLPVADILVVNDGSTDETSLLARGKGVPVVNLPCNLGIGGAMQTGFLYAWQNRYDLVFQLDGDGQHDPAELKSLLEPIVAGRADLVVGSRFLSEEGYKSSFARRVGISFLSLLVSLLIGKRITDATSGFRAMNRKAISLFAREYAVDYPEPEMLVQTRKDGLTIEEVSVRMKKRQGGDSSINAVRSAYYMVKVTLAILIGMLRPGVSEHQRVVK